MVLTGTLSRTPVSRAFWNSAATRVRLSSSTRKAVRPRSFFELLPELGPKGLHEGGGAHLSHAEEPLHVPPCEQLPVELLELVDGVGDGAEPPGLRGHRRDLQRQLAVVLAGGGVNGVRAGDIGPDVDPDAPVAVPDRLCVRLDVGSDGGVPGRLAAFVSTPPTGATAASWTATSPPARPVCPWVAASSSTSAGRPPHPPGAAVAEAGASPIAAGAALESAPSATRVPDLLTASRRPKPPGRRALHRASGPPGSAAPAGSTRRCSRSSAFPADRTQPPCRRRPRRTSSTPSRPRPASGSAGTGSTAELLVAVSVKEAISLPARSWSATSSSPGVGSV